MALVAAMAFGCSKKTEEAQEKPAIDTIGYTIVNYFPHDSSAFTEGLLIHNGKLFESTGDKESWVATVDIKTGRTDRKVELDKKYFGEGMSILNNKLYYLTWKHKTGFIYDMKGFKQIGEFSYETEGWGMTTDGTNLIMSDGTDKLYFLDSATLKPVRTLPVTIKGRPVQALNELEFIDGYIFANVWMTSTVLKIDIKTGEVEGMLDLTEVTERVREIKPQIDVLNGIAWHPQTRLLLVTGKFWPHIYVLKMK